MRFFSERKLGPKRISIWESILTRGHRKPLKHTIAFLISRWFWDSCPNWIPFLQFSDSLWTDTHRSLFLLYFQMLMWWKVQSCSESLLSGSTKCRRVLWGNSRLTVSSRFQSLFPFPNSWFQIFLFRAAIVFGFGSWWAGSLWECPP